MTFNHCKAFAYNLSPFFMSIRSCFLIDDDDDDRDIFALALKKAYGENKCVMAKNGIDAVKIIDEDNFTPTHIFVDLNMPLMSGKDCLRVLKKSRFSRVPVIVYTTSSNAKDIEETQKLGATHYLVKPTSISNLSRILNNLFDEEKLPYYICSETV